MAISAELVKKLRDMTGAGFMECKAALVEAKGDLEAAVTLLRKRGLASASAALHSIMPAPVLSRSCFTIAAEISIVVIPHNSQFPARPKGRPEGGLYRGCAYKESAGSQAGA